MDATMNRIWARTFLKEYESGVLWGFSQPVDVEQLLQPLTEEDLCNLTQN